MPSVLRLSRIEAANENRETRNVIIIRKPSRAQITTCEDRLG